MVWLSYKKLFTMTKGYSGQGRNCVRSAMPRLEKALQKAYIERKQRKRLMRTTWIMSINAGVREHHISYSRFIYGLNHSNMQLDRKVLADLCINEPFSFKAVVEEVKQQTAIGLEARIPSRLSLDLAAQQGLLVKPGSVQPSLEEAQAKAEGQKFDYRKGWEYKFTKHPALSYKEYQEMRKEPYWDEKHEELFEGVERVNPAFKPTKPK